jgi:hypothetical protein
MSSDVFFLGAVGMINSLRLLGHREPIFLLDLGLEGWQRELLEAEATVIPAPADKPPWLLKTAAPLRHPAETMVLIDADMVVTRPLGGLIAQAAEGRVVAFENEMDRFVPEWGELLDLGEVRRQAYVCSGLVLAGGALGAQVLRLMDDRQRRVEFEHTYFAGNVADYPLLYLDQDILNAILASRVEPDRVAALPYRLAPMPPFDGLEVIDEGSLRCAYADGAEPYVVHHFVVKPWLEPTHEGVYSRLLRRLLTGPEVAIRVPEREIPLRLRSGPLAYLERKRVNAGQRFRWHVGEPLSARVRSLRGRRASEAR